MAMVIWVPLVEGIGQSLVEMKTLNEIRVMSAPLGRPTVRVGATAAPC